VKSEEGQLISIAPLKCDASVNDVEEAASTQSLRVPPLQDGPLAILEEVFGNANHLGRVKALLEHGSNSLTAMDWALGYLMVNRVRLIKGG